MELKLYANQHILSNNNYYVVKLVAPKPSRNQTTLYYEYTRIKTWARKSSINNWGWAVDGGPTGRTASEYYFAFAEESNVVLAKLIHPSLQVSPCWPTKLEFYLYAENEL